MAAAAALPASEARRSVLVVFSGLVMVMFLAALDQTIVATALPTIVGDLGGLEHLSWVVTAYLLAQTAVTPLYGKLGDLYGRKRVLQIGLGIFLLGSALCGLSESMGELIAFRAIQGLGGGGLIVSAQAAIGDVVPPRDRGRYQGIFGGVFGVASVAGPLLGGFFTTHVDWRWIFYVNLPLGAVASVVLAATLPSATERVEHRIDYLGTALLAAGLSAVILLTTLGGNTVAWSSPTIPALGVVAALLLVGFVIVERRAAEPVLPLPLFSNRVFAAASVVGLIVGFALFGAVTYLPLFLQVVNGATATGAGLQLLPLMAGLIITSLISGQLISRTGRYKAFPILGTAITVIGLLLLSTMDAGTSRLTASAYMFVLGTGLGGVMQVLVLVVQNAVDYRYLGVATSGATLFRFVGGSLGTAVLGAIFTSQLDANLADRLPSGARAPDRAGIDPSAVKALPGPVHDAFIAAFTDSLNTVFLFAAGIAALAFVGSWMIKQIPLRDTVATAGVGEAFAVPKDTASLAEIERELSVLTRREASQWIIERVAARAGVELDAAECWLLARLEEDAGLDPSALGARFDVPLEVIEAALARLARRELIETVAAGDSRPVARPLTPAGEHALEQLVATGRRRLAELLEGWEPDEHRELGELIARLARQFFIDFRGLPPARA